MPPVELKSLVQEIVDRITVAADWIEIQLSRAKIAAALQVGERGQRPDLDPVVLSIEAKVRRAGKGKRLVIGNGAETEVNAGLVELIKEAFAIRNQLLSGSHDSIEAMSGRLGMNKGRLTSLVRLSYLGPEIVRPVAGEPVSASQFPLANREFNREFVKFGPFSAILAANHLANSNACSKIP
jgi:site-specific DNA recombinase